MKEMKILWKACLLSRKSAIVDSNKFTITYIKGKIVKAIKGTLGIFCFETRKDAEDFIGVEGLKYRILKVEPIGECTTPKKVVEFKLFDTDEGSLNLFYNQNYAFLNINHSIPKGTVCCEAVRVLT